MSGDVASRGSTPVWPFLLASVAIGLLIGFGKIHTFHNSDSIVPVLVSLYRWTPYFWQQNRFGMLVPLLALPVKDPYANLLVQNAITASCGVAAVYLVARLAIRDACWPIIASVFLSIFLLLFNDVYYFMLFSTFQPYNVSLCLAAGALLVVQPGNALRRGRGSRLGAGFLMMAAAHWVNASTALLLGPFVAFMGLDEAARSVRRFRDGAAGRSTPRRILEVVRAYLTSGPGLEILLITSGFAFGLLLQKSATYQTTWPMIASPGEVPSRIRDILLGTWESLRPNIGTLVLLAVGASGILLTLVISSARLDPRTALVAPLSLAMAAIAYSVVVTLIFPPRWRYCLPAVIFIGIGLISPWVPLCNLLGATARRRLTVATTLGALIVAASENGVPSLSQTYRSLDRRLGTLTNDLVDARCTHLAGDYWKVWTAVFHANHFYHERGRPERIWGLTHRSEPTRDLWSRTPTREIRLAVPIGDTEFFDYLDMYGFNNFRDVEARDAIRALGSSGADPRPAPPRP